MPPFFGAKEKIEIINREGDADGDHDTGFRFALTPKEMYIIKYALPFYLLKYSDLVMVDTPLELENRLENIKYQDIPIDIEKDPFLLTIALTCPVDLIVAEPDGNIIDKEHELFQHSAYLEMHWTNESDLDDFVMISNATFGNYKIQVIPEPQAKPDDDYNLTANYNNQTIILAQNIKVSEIPENGYGISIFEGGISLADYDAPVTKLEQKGVAGLNGWFISDVEISFNTSDNDEGSGVNRTE